MAILSVNVARVRAARVLVCARGGGSVGGGCVANALKRAVLCEGRVELLGEVDGHACGEVFCGEVGSRDFAVYVNVLSCGLACFELCFELRLGERTANGWAHRHAFGRHLYLGAQRKQQRQLLFQLRHDGHYVSNANGGILRHVVTELGERHLLQVDNGCTCELFFCDRIASYYHFSFNRHDY